MRVTSYSKSSFWSHGSSSDGTNQSCGAMAPVSVSMVKRWASGPPRLWMAPPDPTGGPPDSPPSMVVSVSVPVSVPVPVPVSASASVPAQGRFRIGVGLRAGRGLRARQDQRAILGCVEHEVLPHRRATLGRDRHTRDLVGEILVGIPRVVRGRNEPVLRSHRAACRTDFEEIGVRSLQRIDPVPRAGPDGVGTGLGRVIPPQIVDGMRLGHILAASPVHIDLLQRAVGFERVGIMRGVRLHDLEHPRRVLG